MLIANCLLLSLFCFLPTANCQLPTAFADEITIRTIVTPIGSQSEKWGAAGLMVCVGGETIPNGGCGTTDISNVDTSTGGTIDIDQSFCPGDEDCGKVFLFIDEDPQNHEFDSSDTIYEVRGSGGFAGFSECRVVEKTCYIFDSSYLNSCVTGVVDCSASCDTDEWLISGGTTGSTNERWGGDLTSAGIYNSYPKTPGLGGTWEVNAVAPCCEECPGGAHCGKAKKGGFRCLTAYALCCK